VDLFVPLANAQKVSDIRFKFGRGFYYASFAIQALGATLVYTFGGSTPFSSLEKDGTPGCKTFQLKLLGLV
jgi:hypothetical protein